MSSTKGNGKMPKGSPNDHMTEDNGCRQEPLNGISTFTSKVDGSKKIGDSTKVCGAHDEVTKSSSEHMQTLKIPEAVVAFAQAAAKANGEPEKYLPGWPLLSPSKVWLQKCDKCSREFCSSINYRRHIRVHRRSLYVDKVSPKTRELLGAFWDKLSPEEAKELASFEDVNLEEVSGSSIIGALTSVLRKPGFSSLPQVYLKAGATLSDVVQGRPSRFPISSQEVFSILDDASEKTFLCAGTASSLQRFVFDGEVGKTAMEMKNLVACTSFLLERKLIKAWLADKDAEALKCQKLLFEEEEAAQKRQAELLERKRMKKLRQKEQKTKQHDDVINPGNKSGLSDPAEACSMETESSVEASELDLRTTKSPDCTSHSALEPSISLSFCPETGDVDQKWEHQVPQESMPRQPILPHRPISKPTRNYLCGFNSQVSGAKPIAMQKHNGYRDLKSSSSANSQKVWTRKSKPEDDTERNRNEREKETKDKSDGTARSEVLIGSICVNLKSHDGPQVGNESVQEEIVELDGAPSSVKESRKLWKQVHREVGISRLHPNESEDCVISELQSETASLIAQDQSCPANSGIEDFMHELTPSSLLVPETIDFSSSRLFSSEIAEAFLSQRWEAAMSADHVKLSLFPDSEAMSAKDDAEESGTEVRLQPTGPSSRSSALGSTGNRTAESRSVLSFHTYHIFR
ncbi:hypothetical protein Taro_011205 [Colocasia esculenta]|uniref:C2H2-type domain-containing protein n=1 Tax=Colocasia esculenta TaxID=4460 RepID=A0A843U0X0_COLES|nr:hypothetical protein [Colocasia esculenta]